MDFHNTVKRFENFTRALKRDIKNRAAACKGEIAFVLDREKDCSVLVKQQEEGTLPLRVTHNDTKLNNILFDADTGKGLCIIDLDTVSQDWQLMILEILFVLVQPQQRKMSKIWI